MTDCQWVSASEWSIEWTEQYNFFWDSLYLLFNYEYEIQNGYYLVTFDSVKCAILKSHYEKTVN